MRAFNKTHSQKLVISSLLASLGLVGVQTISATEQTEIQVQTSAFLKIDDNRDGYLSFAEATEHGVVAKAFIDADDNHDNKLDPDEFTKASAINDRVKVARVVDDSVITAKVKTQLLKDSLVKGLKVNVETYQGAVQLNGFVDNERQAARAVAVAATVKGVKNVINNLIVKG